MISTTVWVIILVIAILLGIILGLGINYWLKTNLYRKHKDKIEALKSEAHDIIKNAKKEAHFQSRQIKKETKMEMQYRKKQINEQANFNQIIKKNLEEKEHLLNREEDKLNKRKEELLVKEKVNINKEREVSEKLSSIAELTKEEAKEQMFKNLKSEVAFNFNRYLKSKETELKLAAKNLSFDIIVQAMERYSSDIVIDKTTIRIELPDNDMKGKIIGKEGRNIKTFEFLTGVDLIIDDKQNFVTLSCFNPIRREVARLTLETLIKEGNIQPVNIENTFEEKNDEIEEVVLEAGQKAIQELEINDISLEMIRHLGMLKYRTSYGQNVLIHSMEVAKLCGTMASELGLNAAIAVRAGLLHDIGKSTDQQEEGSHVTLGVTMAKKYGESRTIINAIHAHHDEVKPETPYAVLVKIADTLSAGRPGARNNSYEDYIVRMQELEDICNNTEGVKNSYVLKSGRQIRVIVDPVKTNDKKTALIAHNIKKAITEKKSIPGDIYVTVIREYRVRKKII